MDLRELKASMPDLHQATCDENKEFFKDKKYSNVPTPQSVYRGNPDNMYDGYLFRASSFGRMMTGLPKPLTCKQKATYEAYKQRYLGIGKPLTEKQERDFFDLGAKQNAKCTLSQGAKTYIEELVREDIFGRRKVIETKYMEKGIEQEVDCIALYSEFTGEKLSKNIERRHNEYFTGECDNYNGSVVRDFKTSWDFNTFPIASTEITNKLYEWQLQAYMDLYNCERAELIYGLVDTSIKQVDDEIRRLDWKYDILTPGGEMKDQHIDFIVERVSNMIYTVEALEDLCDQSSVLKVEWFDDFRPLPIEMRVKVLHTDRNDKMISQAHKMIALARSYMNDAKSQIQII